ncbi:MAG: hypothetical protein JXO51_10520 [Candidatus Aminicenantes bacterium]|nr:hypothetical protein [Candidatus Aminicenantes bacterium]
MNPKAQAAMASLFLALPLLVSGQALTLVAPSAGEFYPRGRSTSISWHSSGLQGNARLLLFKGSTNLGEIAYGIPVTQGKYFWDTGKHEGGMAAVGNGYHIRMRVNDPVHGTVSADGPEFNIGPAQIGTMAVTSPTAASKWWLGRKHTITWTKNPGTHSKTLSIRLFRGSVFYRWVVIGTENDGSFEWLIPAELKSYKNNWLEIESRYTSAKSEPFVIQMYISAEAFRKRNQD